MQKTTLAGAAALLGGRLLAHSQAWPHTEAATGGTYLQPALGYAYGALEPYIDARTMEIHYSRHHAGYVRKLNDALAGTPWAEKSLEETLSQLDALPEALRMNVRNNGGGAWNHSLYWQCMSPRAEDHAIPEPLQQAVVRDFGSWARFQEAFDAAAGTHFGSGWAWLVQQPSGQLAITDSMNQDNPLMNHMPVRGTPLLALDVWEHAYYLKYQNLRTDYITAFGKLVNWQFVASRLA